MENPGRGAWRRWLLLAIVGVLAPAATADEPCLRSGSGGVTITGTLVQKVVPGPPNYTSVNRGDEPQLRWFIRLEASVCVAGDAAETSPGADVPDARVIELVVPRQAVAKYPDLVGRRVVAEGFVSTRQLGGQNPVVLLDVKRIAELPSR